MKRTLNTTINRSKSEKNDEHYTQLADIENEVRHYRDQFKGMTVLCNCDDPRCSNFFKKARGSELIDTVTLIQ